MPTLVLDPQPAWVERLLEERRRSGADRRDEVWDGILHVIPPPSVEHERLAHGLHVLLGSHASAANLVVVGTVGIGTEDDYRVPDLAVLRPNYAPQSNDTAAIVVEIASPRDDAWEKLPSTPCTRLMRSRSCPLGNGGSIGSVWKRMGNTVRSSGAVCWA